MTEQHFTVPVRMPDAASAPVMRAGLERLFAAAAGVIVLPLYAPQPLVELIGPSLGFSPRSTSLVAMMPMLGYAAGLVLLVPLIDVVENRRAILLTLLADFVALAAAAAASSPAMFLLAAFAAGSATSAIQMVVPVAASLAGETHRGRTIGNVMSGLMIGILLSRPVASLAAAAVGWRGAYALDAVAVAAIAVALQRVLPRRQPATGLTYAALIGSLSKMLAEEVYEMLVGLRDKEGLTILLVDQEIRHALRIADFVYVLELGRNKFEGPASEFTNLEKAFWV